jgi:hypothetical protein
MASGLRRFTKRYSRSENGNKKESCNEEGYEGARRDKASDYLHPARWRPFPFVVPLDPDGAKYPSTVYWQATQPSTQYQIVLAEHPKPFKNPPDPILTDAIGRTPTLRMNKADPKKEYRYEIHEWAARAKLRVRSGGGIIVDA